MTKELFLLATLDGLSYAALLFLVALGMTLIFGVMHILNMAHGSMYAFGGYAAASLGLWAAGVEAGTDLHQSLPARNMRLRTAGSHYNGLPS